MKKNPFENLKDVVKLEEVCPVHNVHLQQLDKVLVIAGESKPRKPVPFCPECAKEGIAQKSQSELEKLKNKELYANTYNVLERDSTIPKELKTATFDTFIANTPEERQLCYLRKYENNPLALKKLKQIYQADLRAFPFPKLKIEFLTEWEEQAKEAIRYITDLDYVRTSELDFMGDKISTDMHNTFLEEALAAYNNC